MDPASLETRRVDYTSGNDPAKRFEHIAASHPFTRQVDVVFPTSGSTQDFEEKLSQLSTTYGTGWVRISDLVKNLDVDEFSVATSTYGAEGLESSSGSNSSSTTPNHPPCWTPQIVSLSPAGNDEDDDVWCIDPRGVLTMYVSKESYERLGLVGRKVPKGWKRGGEWHVIQIPLQKNAEGVTNRARRDSALKIWDEWREQNGLGPWRVGFWIDKRTVTLFEKVGGRVDRIKDVRCEIRRMTDIHVPVISIPTQPKPKPKKQKKGGVLEEEEEDWERYIESIFEWVGMAYLGAQRLQGNDRVDPYIAVYEPPEPSIVGDVTHIRWKGLMRPEFVQSILDTTFGCLKGKKTHDMPSFVAVTCSALSASPVSYIPPASLELKFASGAEARTKGPTSTVVNTPIRVPTSTAEDTFCIVATPTMGGEDGKWVMGESIGRFDSRRG
ncbi:hypothetical protein BDN72DRAFT_825885 [Pluteus cervinus]|uniref:Uncharacterized protein n=1 Tax=Pluteus cervinus TaxID=181527 RepID=A0ACD3AES2_9AGAR|nr:hypothetical protein BDN72DRAFT_825885 [Pluteus cervinus]